MYYTYCSVVLSLVLKAIRMSPLSKNKKLDDTE